MKRALVWIAAGCLLLSGCGNVSAEHPDASQTPLVYVDWSQLDALNESFTDYFAEPEHRTLLFADKFPLQYFANTYGLHCYAAFSGCSSDTEPSIATISNLMHLVESDHLSKVYYLEVSSPAVANVIGEQTGATPTVFQSCHTLTQTDFDNGETYVSLMQRNLKALESQ